mgnify:CR=1 FL=1
MNLENNKSIYIDNLKDVGREGVDKVIEWGKDGLFTAPANTVCHNACEGGLCDHSLNVYRRMVKKRN